MRTIKKWIVNTLLFLFPEIQLVQLVREEGFIARKEAPPAQSTLEQSMQSYASAANAGRAGHAYSAHNKQGPTPSLSPSRPVETQRSAYSGPVRNDARSSSSPKHLDQLFKRAEKKVNLEVIGQQLFVKDLVAGYKQGYINKRLYKARNIILLAGAAGTGKKTALERLVAELHACELTSNPHITDINLKRYEADEITGNFIEDVAEAFQYPDGTVLFRGIKEADPAIIQLLATLASEGSFRTKEGVRISAADYFLIFYIDDPVERASEYGQVPSSLTKHLPSSIFQNIQAAAISSPLDRATMRQIAEILMEKAVNDLSRGMQLKIVVHPSAYEALADMAAMNKTFGEAVQHWIENELTVVLSSLRARNKIPRNEKVRIRFMNDTFVAESNSHKFPIKALSFVQAESIDDILKELNALTGLDPVKKFVYELMETVQVNKLRARDRNSSVAMSLHMVFTGNPGTGKTTVARLIGRILKSLELLPQGQLIEVTRQDLVGQYLGSTAPKTMARVHEALGGVLFIDEAYTLARHDHDTFGIEAIDTIVKAMEDHRDNLVVVLAGYSKEMETFLRSNPGLRSRFPLIVEFPDYKAADMLDIMIQMADKNGFRIEAEAYEELIELFDQKQIPGRNDSGNGRLVRNLFEEAVRKQAIRIREIIADENTEADLQLLVEADFGIGEKEAFNIENELAGIVGLDAVKAFFRMLEKQLIVDRRRKEAGVQVDTGQTLNMIFSGNPGTGKTTMARLVAGMLRSMGYLKKGHLLEVGRSDLVGQYVGQTAIKTKLVVESALGGVLFIDEAYALTEAEVQGGGFGKEAIDTLVQLIELHKDNLVVILAGYTDDMQRFVQVNPGMSSRFPLQIEFPDYTAEEMQRIASIMVKARGFKLTEDAARLLVSYFNEKQIPGRKDGGNGRLVRNTLEEAIRKQAERLADDPDIAADKLNELTAEDFGLSDIANSSVAGGNALGKLDFVVGLSSVKEFVRSLSAQIEVAKRRHELGLPKASSQALHMVFTGNPGTGKTTIARILAQRLKELGVIKADTFIETDRAGLVAGYVGQTALKTKEVIERALGGVLFVDEAYSLAEGDQFGQEAIDTLVKAMDDYRDRLIVILAGYDEDMERFLSRNAGLRSRFPNIITFPDYTAEEMLQIAHLLVKGQGYKLAREAEAKLLSILKAYEGDRTAGNGRLVRNLIEKAIRTHALRLSANAQATVEELSSLESEDFEERTGERE